MLYNLSNHEVNFAPGLLRARGVISTCSAALMIPEREPLRATFLDGGFRNFPPVAKRTRFWHRADLGEGCPPSNHILGSDLGQVTRPLGAPLLKGVAGISWENVSKVFCTWPDTSREEGGVPCVPGDTPALRTLAFLVLLEAREGPCPPGRWCHQGAGGGCCSEFRSPGPAGWSASRDLARVKGTLSSRIWRRWCFLSSCRRKKAAGL